MSESLKKQQINPIFFSITCGADKKKLNHITFTLIISNRKNPTCAKQPIQFWNEISKFTFFFIGGTDKKKLNHMTFHIHYF
jgi:hypothetical protein